MPRGGKRYFMADNLRVRDVAELRALVQPDVASLVSVAEHEPDGGMFAEMLLLPPNMRFTGADPSRGGGQVFLLLQGTLHHHSTSLAAPASVVLTRDEPALRFAAGADGLQALILQYPGRTGNVKA